jgi:5-methylcytosine-specific restriction endonuclease McrA
VYLPDEIPGLPSSEPPTEQIDPEAVDFYTDRRFVNVLIKREHSLCFWCSRQLGSSYVLDHAIPIVKGGDNSYRNIVACCHECNALKQASEPEDFLRGLYRRGLLSQSELEERLLQLRRLLGGELVPEFQR